MPEKNRMTTITFKVDFPPVAQPRQRYRCFVPYARQVKDLIAIGQRARPLGSASLAFDLIKEIERDKRLPKAIGYLPADHRVNAFKDNVREAWRRRPPTDKWTAPAKGPIAIKICFVMTRPQSKIWKTRAMPREKDCRKTNDWDNLAKAFCDALIGEAYEDDGQIWRAWIDRVVAAGNEKPHVLAEIEKSDSELWEDSEKEKLFRGHQC